MQDRNKFFVKLVLTKIKLDKVYVWPAQWASIAIMKTQRKLSNAQQGSSALEVPKLETSNPVPLAIIVMSQAKLLELIASFATWATTAFWQDNSHQPQR